MENLISLLFGYLVILLFVFRFEMKDTRNGIEEATLLIHPFCTFRNFIFPSSSFFFFVCDLLFGTSNETTREDYKIIL